MSKKARKFTVRDYYAEEITVGGLPTTRGQFIEEMKAAGHSQQRIDMFLMGKDRGHESRLRAEERRLAASIKEVKL